MPSPPGQGALGRRRLWPPECTRGRLRDRDLASAGRGVLRRERRPGYTNDSEAAAGKAHDADGRLEVHTRARLLDVRNDSRKEGYPHLARLRGAEGWAVDLGALVDGRE